MVTTTLSGIITASGLFSAAYILAGHEKRFLNAFCCFFLTFLSVNYAHNVNSADTIQKLSYIIPATLSIGLCVWVFRNEFNRRNLLFISIFGINSIGSLFGLDNYKIADIDMLDILTWTQLFILIDLGRTPPKEGVYG